MSLNYHFKDCYGNITKFILYIMFYDNSLQKDKYILTNTFESKHVPSVNL